MPFVPWRHVADWRCTSCSDCCRLYSVVLSFHEWLRIVRNYGVEHTASSLNKLFIKRRENGSCTFLYKTFDTSSCGLQRMKPLACKMWPFKILDKPVFGYANDATYHYGKNGLFIYVDTMCNGLRFGVPTWEFANGTLREFIEIAVGLRDSQNKTTARLRELRPYARL